MRAFIDFGAVWVTVVWFAMLFAWPGAVIASVCGWSWSSFAFRRRSRGKAVASAIVAAFILLDGALVFSGLEQPVLAWLPSQSRPVSQALIILLPWVGLVIGAVFLLAVRFRSGR